jgi:hypothetical protein
VRLTVAPFNLVFWLKLPPFATVKTSLPKETAAPDLFFSN